MDNNEIRNAFLTLKLNIKETNEQIRCVLPCLVGRLMISDAGKDWDGAIALSELKRELRNWDIAKQKWIVKER